MTAAVNLKRDAVVVLGIFYSGVGMMCRVLSRCGVNLGSEPPSATIGVDDEDSEVAALSARVLKALDTSWRDPVTPLRNLGGDGISDLHRRSAEEIVARLFGEAELVAFGAPGSPRLLRLWSDALAANGFRLHFVVMVRNPLESAQSLKSQFNISRNAGLLLWANYMIAADLETRNQARVFVRFDDLLADPEAILDRIEARFDLKLPRRTWESVIEIERDVDSKQRRHVFGADTRALKAIPQLRELWDHFESSAREQPRNVDAPRQTEEWLVNLGQTMGPLLAHLGQELRRQETRAREALSEAETTKADFERAAARTVELESALDSSRRDGEARLAEVSGYAAILEARIAALNEELADRSQALRSSTDGLEQAVAALEEERAAAEATRRRSEAAESRLAAADAALADLETRLQERMGDVTSAQARLDQAQTALAAARADAEAVGEANARLEREQATLRAELERGERELQTARHGAAAMEAELTAARANARDLSALAAARADELRAALERASGAEARLDLLERNVAESSEALREAADRRQEAEAENAALQQQLAARSESLREATERIERSEAALLIARAEAGAAGELGQRLESELGRLHASFLDADAERTSLDRLLRQRTGDLDATTDRLSAAELALAASRAEVTRLSESHARLALERAADARSVGARLAAKSRYVEAALARASEAETRLAVLERDLADRSRLLRDATDRLDRTVEALDVARAEAAKAAELTDALERERVDLRSHLSEAEDRIADLDHQLAARSRTLDETTARLEDSDTRLLIAQSETRVLAERVANRDAELAQSRAEAALATAALGRATEAETRLAVLERDLADRSRLLRDATDRLDQTLEALDLTRAEAAKTAELTRVLERERVDLRSHLSEAEDRIADLDHQLATGSRTLGETTAALEASRAQSEALARTLSEAVAEMHGARWRLPRAPWRLFRRRRG